MSRKSFRKSKGRKTRSMRKRTMGGEGADIKLQKEVEELLKTLEDGTYIKENDNFIKLIKKLTEQEERRPSCFYSLFGKTCEKNKAKYYYAAAFALLSRKQELENTGRWEVVQGEVETLFSKANDHSIKANDPTRPPHLKVQSKNKDLLAGWLEAKLPYDVYLTTYNNMTSKPNANIDKPEFVTNFLTELKKLAETAAPAAPVSQGGRKSRRKRKSRRR